MLGFLATAKSCLVLAVYPSFRLICGWKQRMVRHFPAFGRLTSHPTQASGNPPMASLPSDLACERRLQYLPLRVPPTLSNGLGHRRPDLVVKCRLPYVQTLGRRKFLDQITSQETSARHTQIWELHRCFDPSTCRPAFYPENRRRFQGGKRTPTQPTALGSKAAALYAAASGLLLSRGAPSAPIEDASQAQLRRRAHEASGIHQDGVGVLALGPLLGRDGRRVPRRLRVQVLLEQVRLHAQQSPSDSLRPSLVSVSGG